MRNAEPLDEALLVDCGAASSEAPAEEQVLANGEVRKEPVDSIIAPGSKAEIDRFIQEALAK